MGFRREGLHFFRPHLPAMERLLFGGLETRTEPAAYYWDGQRRGGDPNHPYVVFQYTLSGYGIYRSAAGMHRMPAGSAFLAVVPSAHVYYLPEESASWTFFYLILHQPYIVQRLTDLVVQHGAVAKLPPASPPVHRAASLLEGLCLHSFPDALAMEGGMFDFVLEYERFICGQGAAAGRKEWLLATRQYLMDHLREPLVVEQLARRRGMSRSNYSHAFRKATGLSPAAYVAELRLQEVSRQLLHSNAALKEIAAACGFADANHLCKSFRRVYHTSPGQFRRQRTGA